MSINKSDLQPQTSTDAVLLRRVKLGLLLMLIVFSRQIFSGLPEYWPLTRWAMYSGAGPVPEQLSAYEVTVVDTMGTTYQIRAEELGFLGRNILLDAFHARNPVTRDLYRTTLIDRVHTALPNVDAAEIEGWYLIWDVEPDTFPPVDLEHPRERNSLGKFPVEVYSEPVTAPDSVPDLLFGDSLELVAFQVSGPNEVRPCEQLFVRSWWGAVAQPVEDYHITLTLADGSGIGRAQSDSPLAYELTSQWQPGHETLDRRAIPIPCDLPAGEYNLLVGLYELETVQNLEITYPDGTPYGQLAYLTTIEVKETAQE